MAGGNEVEQASSLARRVRQNVVEMIYLGQSSHVGSCLSMADLIACTYSIMNVDASKPDSIDRDFFILSKGHAGAAVYATLAELGFFEKERLKLHYKNGSTMSGHVSHKHNPGVEFSTGSLGHGLAVCAGIAYAHKLVSRQNKTYCILSDGELDEGSNWEAFQFAGHHGLSNLRILVDYNKLQSIKSCEDTVRLEPLADKLEAFNWTVRRVDGHCHESIIAALKEPSDQPVVLICDTIKGKGVSFMEGKVRWHYTPPNEEEFKQAIAELGGQ